MYHMFVERREAFVFNMMSIFIVGLGYLKSIIPLVSVGSPDSRHISWLTDTYVYRFCELPVYATEKGEQRLDGTTLLI